MEDKCPHGKPLCLHCLAEHDQDMDQLQAELEKEKEFASARLKELGWSTSDRAKLQAQVAGMENVIKNAIIWLEQDLGLAYHDRLAYKLRNFRDSLQESLLSPTPAGEWVSVRREDLERLITWEWWFPNTWAVLFNRLKAALGTGGKEQ